MTDFAQTPATGLGGSVISMLERLTRVPLVLLAIACDGTVREPTAPNTGGSAPNGGNLTGGATSPGAGGSSPGAGSTSSAAGGTTNVGGSPPLTEDPDLAEVAVKYFAGQVATPAPKRLVRLTRAQLDGTVRALLPEHVATTAISKLPSDPLQTNYQYADNLGFNAANFTPFTEWVASIAASVEARPTTVIDCAKSGDSPSCLAEGAKTFVNRAFRGTLSDAELSRFVDFFVASASVVGVPAATRDLVDVTLTSPRFAFRDEVLTDSSGALRPAQLLQHVTYTLADSPPEALGLSSATPEVHVGDAGALRKTIDDVLASPAARRKLLDFLVAWLEVKEPDQFTIATSVFPEFTPDVAESVVNETKLFLEDQLGKAAPRMKDLTEANTAFVSGATAFLYGKSMRGEASRVEVDAQQRLGIFTDPAVIASHSGPTTSRLVKRGVFFVRKVMCIPLGAPPSGIDTTVPEGAGETERERIETVTADSPCVGCHAMINPFGFMLENYDAIGRWRTRDEGHAIDASIDVAFLDEGPLTASSPVDALRTFTRSWRFQQCFTRQLFRFYLGRDEVAADDPVLRQMFVEFADKERQDIVQLLRRLTSEPAFSQRSELP